MKSYVQSLIGVKDRLKTKQPSEEKYACSDQSLWENFCFRRIILHSVFPSFKINRSFGYFSMICCGYGVSLHWLHKKAGFLRQSFKVVGSPGLVMCSHEVVRRPGPFKKLLALHQPVVVLMVSRLCLILRTLPCVPAGRGKRSKG